MLGLALVAPPPTRAQSPTSKPRAPIFVLFLLFVLFWCFFDCAFALFCIPAIEGPFLVLHGRVFCWVDHHDVLLGHPLERGCVGVIHPFGVNPYRDDNHPLDGCMYSNSTRAPIFILLSIFVLAYVHFHRTSHTPSEVALGREHAVEGPLLHLAFHRLSCATGIFRGAS